MPSWSVHPAGAKVPQSVGALADRIESDGGSVLAAYREPIGKGWHLFAILPLAKVDATPFQRKPSPAHVKRLTDVMKRIERFVDPILVVAAESGGYWTPNGNHRRIALAASHAREVPAVVVPETSVQYQILALNTEKAHNLRERCHEALGIWRDLSAHDEARRENEFALELEAAHYVTLGLVYEARGRFAGSAYVPMLRRIDKFLRSSLRNASVERLARRDALLAADDLLGAIIERLRSRGVKHPYVRMFVLSRCNPLTRSRKNVPDFDVAIEKLTRALARFDAGRVRLDHVAGAAIYGAPVGEGEG
jgi:ParB family chromosome partitioning protein